MLKNVNAFNIFTFYNIIVYENSIFVHKTLTVILFYVILVLEIITRSYEYETRKMLQG